MILSKIAHDSSSLTLARQTTRNSANRDAQLCCLPLLFHSLPNALFSVPSLSDACAGIELPSWRRFAKENGVPWRMVRFLSLPAFLRSIHAHEWIAAATRGVLPCIFPDPDLLIQPHVS